VRRRKRPLAALVGAVLPLLAACGQDGRIAAQRERLAEQHRARMEALERVEARLVSAANRRSEWGELQERHGRVSAIACEAAAEHVAARDRQRERRQHRARRIAARGFATGEGGPLEPGTR
jgi:hypothetical protein